MRSDGWPAGMDALGIIGHCIVPVSGIAAGAWCWGEAFTQATTGSWAMGAEPRALTVSFHKRALSRSVNAP